MVLSYKEKISIIEKRFNLNLYDGIYNIYCELCLEPLIVGCENRVTLSGYDTIFHHLDSNRLNDDESNIQIVCYRCHYRITQKS